MLYTQQEASLSPQYRQALERLAAAAAQRGHAAGGRYKELPVMLQPAGHGEGTAAHAGSSSSGSGSSSGSSSRPEVGGCRADTDAGLLVAPMAVEAEQLYEAVDRLGGPIMSALRRRQQREAELASLRTQVERKVMLRCAGGRPCAEAFVAPGARKLRCCPAWLVQWRLVCIWMQTCNLSVWHTSLSCCLAAAPHP